MTNSRLFLLIFLGLSFLLYWYSLLASKTTDQFVTFIETPSPKNSSLLNLKDFHYILTPRNVCQNYNSSIVLVVTSYAGDATARSAQRQAYSSEELLSIGINRVFLLAQIVKTSEVTQSALEDENRRFGDILQGGFDESYRNLTYKHAMGLNWAANACPRTRYIIKMDDDIAADLYKIVDVVNSYEIKSRPFDFLGYVFKKLKPKRITANKWYVTWEEYERNYYPTFVSGWLYVTTPNVARRIVRKASDLKYFWIDDVFLTGVVAEILNLSHSDINKVFTTHPESLNCCISHRAHCEYSIGPSGGDLNVVIEFQRHSKKCWSSGDRCIFLRKISQICVIKKTLPQLGRGLAVMKQIPV